LSFPEQNRSRGIGSSNRLLLQNIRDRWGKIAKSLAGWVVGWYSVMSVVYDMSSHECLRLHPYFGKLVATLPDRENLSRSLLEIT
jgi:hypothetical protein